MTRNLYPREVTWSAVGWCRRRLIRAVFVALGFVPAASTVAFAADAKAFARQIALSYHVDPRHVVTADIDRDGDLDVLASTDDGFKVWLNDGAGRFTSRAPESGPLANGQPGGNSWNGTESLDRETIQSESIPIDSTYAHAPPAAASRSTATLDVVFHRSSALGSRTPRAPPFA